ncbi:MAG TPA: helix-turn-helix transcriptional regulator [Pyrinomonadaceae bacterium]|nr:helix-turn-helix transcriptional regulator [Pyrinomonadaceae bacterium]
MPTKWTLRELLKERGVKSASEISRSLEEIGHQLSVQAVCDLLNRQPKMIRLETIEAICNAFYIPLSEFLEVLPMASQKPQKKTRTRQPPSDEERSERGIAGLVQVSEHWIMPDSIRMRGSFHQGQQRCEERCKHDVR